MKKKTIMGNMPPVLPKDYMMAALNGLYENGLPSGLYTGLDCLDKVCRLDKGRLLTITGIPNHGKSEFVDYLVCTYNKRYGYKTLYFSPENQPVERHIAKLISKFTGKPFDKTTITSDETEQAAAYILDNFFFFNYEMVRTLKDILSEADRMVQEKGIDILVLDAYNKIECELPHGVLETNFISMILDSLCDFAIRHNVLVILVAHPRKMEMERDGKTYKRPTAYDINGSANFYNKSDFIMSVHRDFKQKNVIISVDKVKFSNYGSAGHSEVRVKYDLASGNYYEGKSGGAYTEDDDDECAYDPQPFVFPEMTTPDPLNVEVSLYKGVLDNIGTTVNLKQFLLNNDYMDIAGKIRKGASPEERHAIKDKYKSSLPCITVAGTFSKRDSKSLLKSSGLMSIDIDYKDNMEIMDGIPEILKGLPYIIFFSRSISGDGYFAITRLNDPDNFMGHFLALQDELKEYGITVDKSCKDVSRLRFASYDMEAYYNPNATAYCMEFPEYASMSAPPAQNYIGTISGGLSLATFSNAGINAPMEFTDATASATIEELIGNLESYGGNIPDDYTNWYNMSMSLASLGEPGRTYFHRLSSRSSKYNLQECDKQFDNALKYGGNNHFTAGTVIKMLKDAMGGTVHA